MKHSKFAFKKNSTVLTIIFLLISGIASAQNDYNITGRLVDTEGQAVMFANIVLKNRADSSIIVAAISDEQGSYNLRYNQTGTFILSVSYIGYRPFEKKIDITTDRDTQLEPIVLRQDQNELEEVVVSRERVKAKQEADKTTYYVNKKMRQASNTGADIVGHIPGVQTDLFQNITLEGSDKIIIQVNGTQRSPEFLSRINSDRIDRIEIKTTAGARYDAGISGIINVILKKAEKGIAGYVYADIPVKTNEVYSFPSAGIDFNYDKLSLFASYNGIFSYFDIQALNRKKVFGVQSEKEFLTQSDLFQKNRSHKGHFGANYQFKPKSRLKVYSFVSRFHNEQDGSVQMFLKEDNSLVGSHELLKDDRDQNTSAYASVNYEHLFNSASQLDLNADFYLLNSRSTTYFSDAENKINYTSSTGPQTRFFNTKLDYRTQISKSLTVETGAKHSLKILSDALLPSFNYQEDISSAYFSFTYKAKKLQTDIGMRGEYAQLANADDFEKQNLCFLPNWHFQYNFSTKHQLRLVFKKQVIRPFIYALNPRIRQIDMFTQKKGKPDLPAKIRYRLSAEFGMNYGDNFLTAGIFWNRSLNVHEYFTQLTETDLFEKEARNLGNINHTGIKLYGSLKPLKNLMLNPHIQLYRAKTQTNRFAQEAGISNRSSYDFRSELSAVYLFKSDLTIALSVKYNSPITGIQSDYHEDALYFLSAEKTFFERLKIGITTAAPFKTNFTYRAYEIEASTFNEFSEENIQMSAVPVWFKLKYSFSSGKKTRSTKPETQFKEQRQNKGF